MRKKNLFLRIALLLLITTVATSGVFMGTGTTAKYVAEGNVTASARVALFKVLAMGKEFQDSGANPVTISSTSKLSSNGVLYEADCATAETAAHVKTLDTSIIAPGTGGKFVVDFENKSEVGVRFWLDSATSTATGITDANIEYSSTGTSGWGTLANALSDGTTAGKYIDLDPDGKDTTGKIVYWRWAFSPSDAQDVKDTALGVAGNGTLTLTIKIKAEQRD